MMIKPLVRALKGGHELCKPCGLGDVYLIQSTPNPEPTNFYEGIPGIWVFVNVNFNIYKNLLKLQYIQKQR